MPELNLTTEELAQIAERLASQLLEHLDAIDQAPRYLDLPAAVVYLSLPEGQLRKLVQAKKIPHLRPGRRIVFDRHELDNWMRRHAVNERARPLSIIAPRVRDSAAREAS